MSTVFNDPDTPLTILILETQIESRYLRLSPLQYPNSITSRTFHPMIYALTYTNMQFSGA